MDEWDRLFGFLLGMGVFLGPVAAYAWWIFRDSANVPSGPAGTPSGSDGDGGTSSYAANLSSFSGLDAGSCGHSSGC